MTKLSLIFGCLYFYSRMFSSACKEVMVHPGQTALLPCHCPEAAQILMVKVVKQGVQGPGYCFFYRSGRLLVSNQHLSYKNRVEFKDPQMENGDVSVSLKNVSLNDTGTYECVVGYKTAGRNGTESFRHLNNLTVEDAHIQDRGHTGLILLLVLLPVPLLVLLSVLLYYFCCSSRS